MIVRIEINIKTVFFNLFIFLKLCDCVNQLFALLKTDGVGLFRSNTDAAALIKLGYK